MENQNIPQPLDEIMNRHAIANADLVKASTEQLSFKMVQKGRKGRRLTPNVQEKILTALLKVKPDLNVRRRDLFRYEPPANVVEGIAKALDLIGRKKVTYPEFVNLLLAATINRYAVEVGANRITFYGPAGEKHVEQGPPVSEEAPGRYGEAAIKSAIADAQKGLIGHPEFLKRIHNAGIASYEVNLRSRKIDYKGESQSYRENIPLAGQKAPSTPKTPAKKAKKPAKAKKVRKAIKRGKVWKSGTLKKHRVKKRR